jgi:hypothetical protein
MGANSSVERTSGRFLFWNGPDAQGAERDSRSPKRRESRTMESGDDAKSSELNSKGRPTQREDMKFKNWNFDLCWCDCPHQKEKQQQKFLSPRFLGNRWSKTDDPRTCRNDDNKMQGPPALRVLSASDSNILRDSKSPVSPVLSASDGMGRTHGTPPWAKYPAPLDGWSAAQQQAVMNAIHSCSPQFRRNQVHRQTAFAKLIGPGRPLEGKTVWDCEECFAHVQANRVAFFGPSHHPHHRDSPPARHHKPPQLDHKE